MQFGEALTFLTSESPYGQVSGTRGIELDARATVPTFFEKLLGEPQFVRALSGDQLPAELAEVTCRATTNAQLFETYRRVFLADFDQRLYSYSTRTEKFWLDLYRELWEQYFPFKIEKSHDFAMCNFAPIFTGPLPARYYTALWSEVDRDCSNIALRNVASFPSADAGVRHAGADSYRQRGRNQARSRRCRSTARVYGFPTRCQRKTLIPRIQVYHYSTLA